jgi:hypothetical protein
MSRFVVGRPSDVRRDPLPANEDRLVLGLDVPFRLPDPCGWKSPVWGASPFYGNLNIPPPKVSKPFFIWDEICDQRRLEGPEVLSPPDDIPPPETDLSGVEPLGRLESCKEGLQCMKCNARGRNLLFENDRPEEAYVEFQKGMLGTGETRYSALLTQYFNECLEIFSQRVEVNHDVEKFQFYVNEIRKRVFWPKYGSMKLALRRLVWRSKEADDLDAAVRFQKQLLFIILLEGRQGERLNIAAERDFWVPHQEEVSAAVKLLSTLVAARRGSDGK